MKKLSLFYTIAELKRYFKISDDRTIESCFGKNIIEQEDGSRVLESKYLIEQLGFLPTEPFLTRTEAQKELGINFSQFSKLIRNDAIPFVNIKNACGSANLFLKRDIDNLKQTFITYNYSPNHLIQHDKKFSKLLERMIDYDYNSRQHFVRDNGEFSTFKKYFIEGRNLTEIAAEDGCTKEAIRQRIERSLAKFDMFMEQVEKQFDSFGILQTENNLLRSRLDNYEKLIKGDISKNYEQIEKLFSEEIMGLYSQIENLPLRYPHFIVSSRLWNCLSQYCANNETINSRLTFKWLIELPIDFLSKYRGYGKKTEAELLSIIETAGFIPNMSAVRLDIHVGNIEGRIKDKRRVWEFSEKHKNTPAKWDSF